MRKIYRKIANVSRTHLPFPVVKSYISRLGISRRFAVHDTSSRSSKLMSKYAFRLSEALNLLPSADLRSVGETVVDALSTKETSRQAIRAPDEHGRDIEQHDLRQQQVRIDSDMSF